MAIDYSLLKFSKGTPRVVTKDDARQVKATAEKSAKADVMARDRKLCRVCGRTATEVHEVLPRSRGGVPSLANSVALCAQPKGLCHQLIHAAQIQVVGQHCSNPLTFEMREDIARRVFGRRIRPAHVKVI